MKKKVYDSKYKKTASNPRNLVAGIINSKKSATEEKFNDIDFVAYEVIEPILTSKEQFKYLETMKYLKKIKPVINSQIKQDDLTNDKLSELLLEWREKYEYEIDGVIVSHNGIYKRKEGNPEHSFAFKMVLSEQVVEAKVLDVLWSPSKDGYLKPRIQIEPVVIGGAKIEYATAFNGAFVKNNKIGIGALITLVRSGDVIPHIMSVSQQAKEAKMPDVDYEWNSTNIDIILVNKDDDKTVKQKNITGFFVGLDIKGLGPGNIKRLINAGYDSIEKIISLSVEDLLSIDGFQKKKAEQIYKSIKDGIECADILQILSASNIFGRGFGIKKLKPIFKHYPSILKDKHTREEKIANISTISGFSIKSAISFVDRIKHANNFLQKVGLLDKYNTYVYNNSKHNGYKTNMYEEVTKLLDGIKVVISGFRSKDLEKDIEERGGIISNSVTSKISFVIVKDIEDTTGKIEKAKQKNIPIVTEKKFRDTFGI